MSENGLKKIVFVMALVALFSNSVVLFRLHQTIMQMNFYLYSLDVVLALAFSSMSAYAVRYLGFCKDTLRFAAFDAIGILLHFLTFIPNIVFNIIAAIFFSLQFFWQVIMIAKLSDNLRLTRKEEDTNREKKTFEIDQNIDTYIKKINAMGSKKLSIEEVQCKRKDFIIEQCPEEIQGVLLEKYSLK